MIKVYGPYTRKDGRKHVILYDNDTQKRTTVSYPKYLLEQHLGRKLGKDETTDHIDDDFTNDSLDNLQVLTRLDNVKKAALLRPAEILDFKCSVCGTDFELDAPTYRHNQVNNNRAGPFCSRSCAGKYSTIVQYSKR